MTRATIRRLFPRKRWCIFDGFKFFWGSGICWNEDKSKARVGTRRELQITLNNFLYQHKLRGAKVVRF